MILATDLGALKWCATCSRMLPVVDFNRDAARKDGHHPLCRCCVRAYRRGRRGRASEEYRRYYLRSGRARDLAKRYGLTPADVERMLEEQGRACAVCRRDLTGTPLVDHDHATGRVRGLLCRPCNSGLGHLGDDPERLRAALTYLERGNQ